MAKVILTSANIIHTASLSHLRTMPPESSSCPKPAQRPNHGTYSLFHSKTRYMLLFLLKQGCTEVIYGWLLWGGRMELCSSCSLSFRISLSSFLAKTRWRAAPRWLFRLYFLQGRANCRDLLLVEGGKQWSLYRYERLRDPAPRDRPSEEL